MNLHRKSFALLLVILFLLLLPIINDLLLGRPLSANLFEIFGFVLTLIGIFGGAYFELDRFERQLKEERLREIRQHRLAMLQSIENWVSEVSASIEDIDILRELSPKDPVDNKLIVGKDKIRPITEKLLRLDNNWLVVFAKAADIIGIKKDDGQTLDELKEEHRALLTNIYFIGSILTEIRKTLTTGDKIPYTNRLAQPLTEVRRAIDQIRLVYD